MPSLDNKKDARSDQSELDIKINRTKLKTASSWQFLTHLQCSAAREIVFSKIWLALLQKKKFIAEVKMKIDEFP